MPFPPPGDLSNPGIGATSPALAGGFFTSESPGKPGGCCRLTLLLLDTDLRPITRSVNPYPTEGSGEEGGKGIDDDEVPEGREKMEDGEVDRDNLAIPSYVRVVPEIRVA